MGPWIAERGVAIQRIGAEPSAIRGGRSGRPHVEGPTLETYVARTYVFEKQGKQQEAKVVWNQARKIDRRVKKIED